MNFLHRCVFHECEFHVTTLQHGSVRPTRGWPTFTFFVKVGTHAAGVEIFILASPH